jgi:hypothetical protein
MYRVCTGNVQRMYRELWGYELCLVLKKVDIGRQLIRPGLHF